jgi:hypothetical protein
MMLPIARVQPFIIAQQLVTIAHRLLFLSPVHHRSAPIDDRSSTAFYCTHDQSSTAKHQRKHTFDVVVWVLHSQLLDNADW